MKKFWEVVRNVLCVIGALAVGYFAFIGFFCGPSAAEPYNQHKMSQVAVPPPKPLWQTPLRLAGSAGQEDRLRRITENLQHGLDNLPQYQWKDYQPPQPTGAVSYQWKEYAPLSPYVR